MRTWKVAMGVAGCAVAALAVSAGQIGQEVAVARHLENGEEYELTAAELFEQGRILFNAMWTNQEGGGRPLTKGSGAPVADPSSPLVFPRSFNRISAPDANSCAGCHNLPISGGGGDIVANVFVLGQRFDFATFDGSDDMPTRGATNEAGDLAQLQNIANSRGTTSMFGSGYLEMLARQMTDDLLAIRGTTAPGQSKALTSKGVSFGTLTRRADGTWDTSGVLGLPAQSLAGATPSLIVHPWHQASAVVSLRQFTNNAMNHHHGIQTTERFGTGTDPDGDDFVNEMSRADVTATSIYQAGLPVPGRLIPRDAEIEAAVLLGEQKFAQIGCNTCHVERLPLTNQGWIYSEPNPYNPAGNLRPGDAPQVVVNLNNRSNFPGPRLRPDRNRITWVPAYTDMKLHDITSGPNDPNREALNMHFAAGTPEFFAGNGRFLTKRLWGAASEPPYFHHGMYTTLREAVLAHAGESQAVTDAFNALPSSEQDAIIEFLKTLQILPKDTQALVIDENGNPRDWPPGS
jgi:cytochrome c peroxidase